MPNIAPSFVTVNPSYMEAGVLVQYSQASGAYETIADGQPLPRLSEGDLYVYMKTLQMRHKTASGQAAYNQLPSMSTTVGMISTPSYLVRMRGEYDHHDTAAMSRWGLDIVSTQRLGARQGHFQTARNALLQGFNPANGEGLLNTVGATAVNLPPDSFGNTTVVTYDNGQMAIFFLTQISAIKTRTMQLGLGQKIVILGPQRTLGALEYQNIVQLTQYQRPGGGTATTAGVLKAVMEDNDDEVIWAYDDTLIGKGAGGGNNDAVLIVMPEVKKPAGKKINTNAFAELAPGIEACALQYCDMAAPREIPSPLAGGAVDMLSEWRITSGWGVRPEAVTIARLQYQ